MCVFVCSGIENYLTYMSYPGYLGSSRALKIEFNSHGGQDIWKCWPHNLATALLFIHSFLLTSLT